MKNLSRYFSVLEGKEKPKFVIAGEKSLEKIKEAEKIMKKCEFCERKCRVNRLNGKVGFCGVGNSWRIFGAHIHLGEEKELVPSGTLFLAGCPLRCVYCQNAPDSIDAEAGGRWSDREVVNWINRQFGRCKNINFVSPDCYVWNILKVLNKIKVEIPIIWNSSSYYSEKTAELIKDVVDVYLLDFRYFKEECGKRLSGVKNYPEIAKRNMIIANEDAELLIRALVIPGHIECCAKPILKWIVENLGDVRVNIMSQYRPVWQAYKFEEINKYLTEKEFEEVLRYARELGLKNLG